MTTSEQLHFRAVRMLGDGLRHAPAALEWARDVVSAAAATFALQDFTLRELSLGAMEVASS